MDRPARKWPLAMQRHIVNFVGLTVFMSLTTALLLALCSP
jgi:hypothetical protein